MPSSLALAAFGVSFFSEASLALLLNNRHDAERLDASVGWGQATGLEGGQVYPSHIDTTPPIPPYSRYRSLEGVEWQKLRTFSDAAVSCKGEINIRNASSATGWNSAPVRYDGCFFSRGSCKARWNKGPSLSGPPEPCTMQDARGHKFEQMYSECSMPQIGDTIVVLTQPQWGAYYHFLIDSLPRIVYVKEQRPELLTDPKTFFHVGMSNEVAQTWARMVGIDTQLVPGKEGEMGRAGGKNRLIEGWWGAKNVIWPPSNGCVIGDKHAEPVVMNKFRSLVVGNSVASGAINMAKTKPVALLVRRDPRSGKARSLGNHDELLAGIQSTLKGWNVEVFSDYPQTPEPRTACGMFNRADMIIGPHGAGFANLVCARQGVPLVEVQQGPHVIDFELLSSVLGQPYFGVPTDMIHNKGPYTLKVSPALEQVAKAAASVEKGRAAAQ